MFALFEDDFPSFMRPQASLPSAAQPAVMDIRPLRGRLLEIPYHKCESSEIKKIVSIVSIVFKNHASGWASPFHINRLQKGLKTIETIETIFICAVELFHFT